MEKCKKRQLESFDFAKNLQVISYQISILIFFSLLALKFGQI